MNISRLIFISIITSNVSYAMDNQDTIVRFTSKDDSSKLVTKKKNPVIVKPTKSITLEDSLGKRIAVKPYELRVHIKDLFTIIPFNGEKKRLNEWIMTKNKEFSKTVEHLYFDGRHFNYNGTVKKFTTEDLRSISLGRGFYYSNSNHQINLIGIWIGELLDDSKNKKNPERTYCSLLLAHYMAHKGLIELGQ